MGLHVPLRVFRSHGAVAGAPGRDRRRLYPMTPPGRAHALSLAFRRYLELHGRSVTVPRDGCAIHTAGSTLGQTVILDFWSRRAAEDFDYFWRRYRPTFGEIDAAEAKTLRAVA